MHNILLQIIEKKKKDLFEQKKKVSMAEMKNRSLSSKNSLHSHNSFKQSILSTKDLALIAEIKLASPTAPSLGLESDSLQRAIAYEKAGADALSYITEKHFFKGNTTVIPRLKTKVTIPILQKDFVIDPYQIYEAKSLGSDALLLITRLIDATTLKHFVELCFAEGIEPVVEINDEEDLKKALVTPVSFLAVNARNLETFTVDVGKACALLIKIPDTFIKLGFSGINSSSEVKKYKESGAKGVLVGTSLMRATNIKECITNLKIYER